MGQVVYTTELSRIPADGLVALPTASWNSGVYAVTVTIGNQPPQTRMVPLSR